MTPGDACCAKPSTTRTDPIPRRLKRPERVEDDEEAGMKGMLIELISFLRSASSAADVAGNAKDAGRRLLRKSINDEDEFDPAEVEASGRERRR